MFDSSRDKSGYFFALFEKVWAHHNSDQHHSYSSGSPSHHQSITIAELQAMTPGDVIGHYSAHAIQAYGALADTYGHGGGGGHAQLNANIPGGGQGQHPSGGAGGGQGWPEDPIGTYYAGLDPKECVNCGTTKI